MKDIIYVEKKNFVSIKDESLKFKNVITEKITYIPIDEVEWLVFTNQDSWFSHMLVTKCLERKIGILFCDEKHSPKACLVSSYGHSQRVKRLELQISLVKKTRNRIWRKIVMGKINNQSKALLECTGNYQESSKLELIGKQVQEGDTTYRESHASRMYFKELFGEGFKRGRYKDPVNAGLNYGYAILRSLIRQELVMHGLEPSVGINHHSNENPFNLSDDIIEVFRPFVDIRVYEFIFKNEVAVFSNEDKNCLFNLFLDKCVINDKVHSIPNAIRIMISSYIKCLENNSAAPLKLPSFIEGGK